MPRTQSGGERDAVEMLLEDHKRVQRLFKDFEKVTPHDEEAMRELVVTVLIELQIHSMLEEEIFYPAVRGRLDGDDGEDLLNEAEVEHEAADELIAKLQDLGVEDPMYPAYFAVLAEYVRHHIREEEKEILPLAKRTAGLDLRQLAGDMRRRRDELFSEIEKGESEIQAARALAPADEAAPRDEDEGTEDEAEAIDISKTRH